jgi:hypothetical protein
MGTGKRDHPRFGQSLLSEFRFTTIKVAYECSLVDDGPPQQFRESLTARNPDSVCPRSRGSFAVCRFRAFDDGKEQSVLLAIESDALPEHFEQNESEPARGSGPHSVTAYGSIRCAATGGALFPGD